MANYCVLCSGCEAENQDYEDRDGTYWFTCVECGIDNELVYALYK